MEDPGARTGPETPHVHGGLVYRGVEAPAVLGHRCHRCVVAGYRLLQLVPEQASRGELAPGELLEGVPGMAVHAAP